MRKMQAVRQGLLNTDGSYSQPPEIHSYSPIFTLSSGDVYIQ